MAFINNYTPSQYPLDLYGPDPWDINVVFPVPVSIENDVVRLTPKEDLLKQLLDKRESAESCLFLIVDKTKPENPAEGRGLRGVMAGLICYAMSSFAHRSAEIGPVIILKSAQRSHVTTNSIGLLMHYALNLPSDATMPGLGLRRVQWMCHSENARSLATARRLGFQMEGTLRWLIVCAEGSSFGDKPRVGDPVQKRGRHDLILSMCWDQWSSEGRAIVERQMARCL